MRADRRIPTCHYYDLQRSNHPRTTIRIETIPSQESVLAYGRWLGCVRSLRQRKARRPPRQMVHIVCVPRISKSTMCQTCFRCKITVHIHVHPPLLPLGFGQASMSMSYNNEQALDFNVSSGQMETYAYMLVDEFLKVWIVTAYAIV